LRQRIALIYGKDSDNYVIVASRGGNPKHPASYLNLLENPEVEVQVGADKFSARAYAVSGEDRTRLWKLMASVYPPDDSYQAKTTRGILVIVLERTT
jgi:deazaflavin-dependent oxidoreductase (nitroreductase family)